MPGITSSKVAMVPIEGAFLKYWTALLDRDTAGTAICYVALHLPELHGKREYKKNLAKILGVHHQKLERMLGVLEKYNFLELTATGIQLFDLPPVPDVVLAKGEVSVFDVPEPQSIWERDPVHIWTVTHFLEYWKHKYYEQINAKYMDIPKREISNMKRLMKEYKKSEVKEAIEVLLRDYETYSAGPPSIAVLHGYRKSIFPAITGGVTGRSDQWREKEVDKFIDKNKDTTGGIKW